MVVKMDINELLKLHQCAINNRDKIKKSNECGCFYCKKTFSPHEIVDWTDDEETAICPYCGVDSVICNDNNYKITKEDLEKMNEYFFGDKNDFNYKITKEDLEKLNEYCFKEKN